MADLKRFPEQHPWIFSLGMMVIFILMLFAAVIVSNRWPASSAGWYLGGMLVRLAGILVLLLLVARLGWLRSAGFTQAGRWQTWLLMVVTLVYAIAASAYAMTGGFDFSLADPSQTAVAAAFILAAAFLEEVVFRGLVLHAFVRAWGSTRGGILKCVLVSALLFGLYHWINLLDGTPPAEVLLQSLVAFFLGVVTAALVLISGSIYPAVVYHFALNLAGYLNFASQGLPASTSAWLTLGLLMLPLAALGFYLSATRPQPGVQQQPALS